MRISSLIMVKYGPPRLNKVLLAVGVGRQKNGVPVLLNH